MTVCEPLTRGPEANRDAAAWAFAELAARCGLEPELAARYDADPGAVQTEFGLPTSGADQLPGPVTSEVTLSVESLDRGEASPLWCDLCICTFTPDRTD